MREGQPTSRRLGFLFLLAVLICLGAAVTPVAAQDSDGDGIPDDGDLSGDPDDNPCMAGRTASCDDNCRNTGNANQFDDDWDGVGNACEDCPIRFGPATVETLSITGTKTIDAYDITGTSRGDVVIDRGVQGAMRFYGNGAGRLTFRAEQHHPTVGAPIDLALGEFDGDPLGRVDLATIEAGQDLVFVRFGTENQNFDCFVDSYGGVRDPNAIAARDLDNDGFVDLGISSHGANVIVIRWNDTFGGFGGATTQVSTGAPPLGVALADFDGDGLGDVAAIVDTTPQSLCLARNMGSRAFSSCSRVSTIAATQSFLVGAIDAGDFNDDGRPDVATGVDDGSTHLVIIFYQFSDATWDRDVVVNVPGLTDLSAMRANKDNAADLALLVSTGVSPEEIHVQVNSSRDSDDDRVCDDVDNCPARSNGLQSDGDGDSIGDECDNCLAARNVRQVDVDGDGIGDMGSSDGICDTDDDGDGDPDLEDNCPTVYNPDQANSDADSHGDACDNCPMLDNESQEDNEEGVGDGIGDACDLCEDFLNPCDNEDDDNDGVGNFCDNCIDVFNPGQEDTDNDDLGNACDDDDDNDGVDDTGDNCQLAANPDQADYDIDGLGDVCDDCTDIDGDTWGNPGFPNNTCADDNCPFAPNPLQEDGNMCDDGDGVGDACECACRNGPAGLTESCGICEPLWIHGDTNPNPHDGKIDIVLVRDEEFEGSPDGFESFSEFQRDVFLMIEYGLNANPDLAGHLSKYNFYVATDAAGPGDADGDLTQPGFPMVPSGRLGFFQCPWREIVVVVHERPASFADRGIPRTSVAAFTPGSGGSWMVGKMTAPDPDQNPTPGPQPSPGNLAVFVHELGHANFSLMDEYHTSGGFYKRSVGDNVYCTAADCDTAWAAENPTEPPCYQFCTLDVDPNCTLMTDIFCLDENIDYGFNGIPRDGFWKYDPDRFFNPGGDPNCMMDLVDIAIQDPSIEFGPDCQVALDAVHSQYVP